jgi:hypothetical protein
MAIKSSETRLTYLTIYSMVFWPSLSKGALNIQLIAVRELLKKSFPKFRISLLSMMGFLINSTKTSDCGRWLHCL